MNKSIFFVLIVLVALMALYFLSGDEYSSNTETAETKGFDAISRVQDVSKIVISKGKGEPVELKKAPAGWVVASSWNYKANGETVDKIVKAIQDIEVGAVVGRRKSSHRDFELDKKSGSFLTVYDKSGSAAGTLVVGARVPTQNFSSKDTWIFARLDGDDKVYKIKSDITSTAKLWSDIEAKKYLETKVFELEETREISQVRLVREGAVDVIVERRWRDKPVEPEESGDEKDSEKDPEKKDDTPPPPPEKEEYFVVTSGSETHEVDKEKWKARSLINRAKAISIDDVADPAADVGLAAPQLKVLVTYAEKDKEFAEATTVTLLFGNSIKNDDGEDDGAYFRIDDEAHKDLVYKVSKYDFDSWNKKLEDFLPPPPEPEETKDGAEGATPPPAKVGTAPEAPEAGETEAPKVETPKVEAPKVETPKVETPKVETPKVETPKVEAPKVEAPKVEAPKVEAPKAETPKAGTPEAETVKPPPAKAPAPGGK